MKSVVMFFLTLLLVSLTLEGAQTYKYNSIARYYSAYRRRCVEKSLESRESSADAVFTGTIRDMIPDRNNPDTKVSLNRFHCNIESINFKSLTLFLEFHVAG